MKRRAFEKLLKDAILLEAEEQGERLSSLPHEPVPAEAQARFDAALNDSRTEKRPVTEEAVSGVQLVKKPQTKAARWLFGGATAVAAAALIAGVFVLIRIGNDRIKRNDAPMMAEESAAQPADSQPGNAFEPGPGEAITPQMPAEEPPEGTFAPEASEPVPGEASEQKDLLIGTWVLKAMESKDESQSGQISLINAMIAAGKYEATYTFTSDGSGLAYWDIAGEKNTQVFTYVIEENKLTFSGETMLFTIEGDRLTLTEEQLTLLFDRRDSQKSEEKASPEVQLRTQEWQGYTCLFPETFEIQAIRDRQLSATEEALLKLDMKALQTTGLTDMDYYLAADSALNGKDLLAWYLAEDAWDDKPEDFDIEESVEIVTGIESVHYYNRSYNSYICIAKVNTIGTNTLFIAASSMTKAGTADFDSIVKQFVKMNGGFASSDNGILNGKYGKSKVFAGDGYQITLTEQFSEQKSEMGFNGYYTSYFGAVMIKIEPFTLKAGLADKTLTEYMQDVIRNNASDAQPEERDGLVYYRYHRSGMCGWNFAIKGEDAFYLVQFMCREADESELTDLFFAFAKSMTLVKSDNASNG